MKEAVKRLDEEAVVEKRVVVVAFVPEKFCKVDDESIKRLPKIAEEAARLVEEAVVLKKLVEVALPETKRLPETDSASLGVLEAMPRKPLAFMVKADRVEVAPMLVEEVAM